MANKAFRNHMKKNRIKFYDGPLPTKTIIEEKTIYIPIHNEIEEEVKKPPKSKSKEKKKEEFFSQQEEE